MNFEFLQNINDELFLRECPDLYQLCCASEKTVHSQPTASLNNIRTACERVMKFYYVLNGGQNSKATASSIQNSTIVVNALQDAIEAEIQRKEDEINEREKNNKQRIPKTQDRVKQISEKAKIEFIAVDDFQYIKINCVCNILKTLATELGVPIVALVRSSDVAAKREDHHPMQRDLPKVIIEAADVLVLLHRDNLWDMDSDNKPNMEVTISKNSFGPIGTIELASL